MAAEPEGAEEHAGGLGDLVEEEVEAGEGKAGVGADAADEGGVVGAEGLPAEGAGDGRVGDAECGEGRGEVGDAGLAGEADPEFPVDGVGEVGGVAPEAGDQVAAEEDVGGFAVDVFDAEGAPGERGAVENAVGAEGASEEEGAAVGGNDLGGGEDEGDVGGGVNGGDFAGEATGEEEVVGVEEMDVGGGGEGKAAGGIAGLAEIGRVAVDAEAGVGVGGEEGGGGVGGGVVDDDHLKVGEGLGKEGVEGLPEGVGAVVGGDEDGDEGHGRKQKWLESTSEDA